LTTRTGSSPVLLDAEDWLELLDALLAGTAGTAAA